MGTGHQDAFHSPSGGPVIRCERSRQLGAPSYEGRSDDDQARWD